MKITKDEISPVDVRLTVAIDENDYKDEVTKKLKEICLSANSNVASASK